MRFVRPKYLVVPLVAFLYLAPFPAQASADVRLAYQYNLASFTGKAPLNDVKLHADRFRNELYVVEKGNVRVYNETGMEIFWFGDDQDLGNIYDVAVNEKGEIFILGYTYSMEEGRPKHYLVRCNYRGVALQKIPLTELPLEYSGFYPSNLYYRDDRILLVNKIQMRAVVIDLRGSFLQGYDFAEILEIPEKDRPNTEISGFNVDREGNMLLTVTVLFKAYSVSPKGKVTASFGKKGSAPGLFGIVGGIVKDDDGNYLVIERLRSVVMVFDKEFRFLKEFGYRGTKPENLIGPNDLALGNSGRLYVTQVRNLGVSVFTITTD